MVGAMTSGSGRAPFMATSPSAHARRMISGGACPGTVEQRTSPSGSGSIRRSASTEAPAGPSIVDAVATTSALA
jgi:hypothetical protein